jgi:glucose-6-phosphate 1-dehydrogenase
VGEEAWSIVDPNIDSWAPGSAPTFPNYDAGTWGPVAADELLGREGRRWRRI